MTATIMNPTQRKLSEIEKCAADPWYFLTTCCYTKDQVDKINPIKKFPSHWPYLEFYVRAWQQERLIAVPKSRRMTMSWTNIALYLWECLFNKGRDYAFVSKKEDDAAELVRRAEFIYDHIPPERIPREFLPAKDTRAKPPALLFPEIDSKIQGFPMGADQLRQFTFSGILGDECAFWDEARQFYAAAFPTLEGGGRMTLISSRAPGFFQRICYDAIGYDGPIDESYMELQYPLGDDSIIMWYNPQNKFTVIDIHYTANPNKRDPGFKEAIKNSMPVKDFMVEYERNWEVFSGKPVYEDYSKAFHETNKVEAVLGLPLLCGWDFGLCYDDKTEVLTENGWKLFKDVNDGEAVATLNPETKVLEYDIPKLKIEMPFKGEMINWNSQNLQATITPDHIVPHWTESGKFERKYANDLFENPGHRKIQLTAIWNKEEDYPTPLTPMSSKLFAAFMGLYLSEGSLDGNRVCIYQTKEKQWVRDILGSTPYKWIEADEVFRTNDAHLATYLKQFGKAKEKFIPREILNSSSNTIKEFIKSYTLGDGHIRVRPGGYEEHTIFTTSKRMSDDLSEAALKASWYASIRKVKPQSSYYEKEKRWITNSGGFSITFKKITQRAALRATKQTKVPYDGIVYCLSVKHSTLYVRKNGRAHWNGNTPACVVAQLREGRLIILREFIGNNVGIKKFCESQVLPGLAQEFPEWRDAKLDFRHYIDPAGLQKSQTDERTCAGTMMECGLKSIFPGPLNWEARRKGVEHFLMLRTKDGAGLQLNPKTAPTLARGFSGGYCYPEKYEKVQPDDYSPIKNNFSHPHDGLQYLCGGALALKGKRVHPKEIPSPKYMFAMKAPELSKDHPGLENYEFDIRRN